MIDSINIITARFTWISKHLGNKNQSHSRWPSHDTQALAETEWFATQMITLYQFSLTWSTVLSTSFHPPYSILFYSSLFRIILLCFHSFWSISSSSLQSTPPHLTYFTPADSTPFHFSPLCSILLSSFFTHPSNTTSFLY